MKDKNFRAVVAVLQVCGGCFLAGVGFWAVSPLVLLAAALMVLGGLLLRWSIPA